MRVESTCWSSSVWICQGFILTAKKWHQVGHSKGFWWWITIVRSTICHHQMVLNLTHRALIIENRQSPRFPKSEAAPLKDPPVQPPTFTNFHLKSRKQNPISFPVKPEHEWAPTVDWNVTPHRLCSASSPPRSEVLCPIQQCSHETIDREMKTCTPLTCCVQCFLGSHYFWINLCWWQFHCQLLWWYYYGAFILLRFLCSQLFLFYFLS